MSFIVCVWSVKSILSKLLRVTRLSTSSLGIPLLNSTWEFEKAEEEHTDAEYYSSVKIYAGIQKMPTNLNDTEY